MLLGTNVRTLFIDGNHLSGRSNAALKDLRRSDGHYSGTVHGVLQGLAYIRKALRFQFTDMIIVWDGDRCKVRQQLYPDYKGNRAWRQEDLPEEEKQRRDQYLAQIKQLKENLPRLGMRQVQEAGTEADDVIGILSALYSKHNGKVTIYSGDHDLHQCASENVTIYDPKRELLTKEQIERIWEIPVGWIPAYKALCGDATDNIPGIGGIGHVRAKIILPYLRESGFTEKPELDGIPSEDRKWVAKVLDRWDIYLRNLKLVTIPRDWDGSLYSDGQYESILLQLMTKPEQRTLEFVAFLRTWELQSILERVGGWL
jgi:5'-3' exonuclease